MLDDVETLGEKGLREAHGLSVAWGVWGGRFVGAQLTGRRSYTDVVKLSVMFLPLIACAVSTLAQTASSSDYRLALPDHNGQLKWSIEGFKIVENSAKANERELGVRGRDSSGQLMFLAFLFVAPETAPMTSAKCRDASITQDKEMNASLKIVRTSGDCSPSRFASCAGYLPDGKSRRFNNVSSTWLRRNRRYLWRP